MGALRTWNAFVDTSPSPLGRVRGGGTNAGSPGVRGRRYHSYALVYVVAGGGWYRDELGCRCDVAPGHAIIVFPGMLHSYGPGPDGHWDEYYLILDGPAVETMEAAGVLDRDRPVRPALPVRRWAADLDALLARPRPVGPQGRALEVLTVVGLLTRLLVPPEPGPTWLDRGRAALAADLAAPIVLGAVAAECGMTYETFRKRFRAATGSSPGAYREARRVEAARELLDLTTMTHRQIARTLGYGDEFHFSRRFKAATGMPPSAHRAQTRGPG